MGSWKPPWQEQSCAWECREPQAVPSTASFCNAQPIPLSWEYGGIPRPGFPSLLTFPLSRTLPGFLPSRLLPPSHLCFPPTSVGPRSPRALPISHVLGDTTSGFASTEGPRATPFAPGQPSISALATHSSQRSHSSCSSSQLPQPELLRDGLQFHPALMHVLLSGCTPCHTQSFTVPYRCPGEAHVAAATAPDPLTSSPAPKRQARLSFPFPSSFTSAVKPGLLVILPYERLGQPSRMALTPSAPERKKSPPPSPYPPQGTSRSGSPVRCQQLCQSPEQRRSPVGTLSREGSSEPGSRRSPSLPICSLPRKQNQARRVQKRRKEGLKRGSSPTLPPCKEPVGSVCC
ncbi:hypothetical protein CIB84_009922, partial [Bambusicola thoracicus]